jgi:DNA-binding IclR family transcriptional regulator
MMDQERAQGYSLSQGGFESGISTLAAPVFDDEHHVIAALSVTIATANLPDSELKSLIALVQSCAQELTARMSRTH